MTKILNKKSLFCRTYYYIIVNYKSKTHGLQIRAICLEANRKLVKAGEFQLFRTSSERAQQIGAAQQDVFYYNQQVKDIEAELNQLSMK